MEQVVVEKSAKKLTRTLAISTVFVGVGIFLIVNGLSKSDFISISIGVISIAFFGLGALFVIKQATDKRPGLILNREGIVDQSNLSVIGPIAWSDIEKLGEWSAYGQTCIVIFLKDNQKLLNQLSGYKLMFAKKNIELGCGLNCTST